MQSTSSGNPVKVVPLSVPSTSKHGHDRQPSVQLKIEASGGPPLQAKSHFSHKLKRNLSYFFSQLIVLLSQLSPIVQTISALLILFYLIQFYGEITVDFFALTPGEFISPGQWYHTVISIWTHLFVERRITFVLIDMLVLSFCGTLIEPLWGHKEVLRYLFFTCIPSALLTSFAYILLYCITTDDAYLFNVRIHGFMPFCAAVAVTVKQLLPQSILFATSFGRFKNDHIPFTCCVSMIIAYFLHILHGVHVVMFLYGTLTSWFYLRFYQPHTRHSSDASTTTIKRGDLSDAFAFETFFPNVLRPLVAIFSNHVYNALVRINLCPKIPSPAVRLLNESLSSPLADSSIVYYQSKPFNKFPSNTKFNGVSTDSQPLIEPKVENL